MHYFVIALIVSLVVCGCLVLWAVRIPEREHDEHEQGKKTGHQNGRSTEKPKKSRIGVESFKT